MARTSLKQIIYHLYTSDNVFIRVLTEVSSNLSIEKTLYGGSGPVNITFDRKIDNLAADITFNNKIRIYVRNKWSATPTLVYYGYIADINPVFENGQESTGVTCLGAISKLTNDYVRTDTDLAWEIDLANIDSHISQIISHYRTSIFNTYGSYNQSMIDDPTNYWSNPAYITDTTAIGKVSYIYFNDKHLDAVKEIVKFLPKNDGASAFWYWYVNDEGRFVLKILSATPDHKLFLKKHCVSINMSNNIEGVVNKVFFWNEMGTYAGEMVRTSYDDATSQLAYDVIADDVTDSSVSTYLQAQLLAGGKVLSLKDPNAAITLVVSDAKYNILTFNLGQVVQLFDVKNSSLFPVRLVITKYVLENDQITLTLSTPRPDLTTQVAADRAYINNQLKWFGQILTQIDGTRISTGVQQWTMQDIAFTPVGNNIVTWTAGAFILPNAVKRVIAAGTTGVMNTALSYYLYVDEKNVWCGKDTGLASVASGTASMKLGDSFLVAAGSPGWTGDQWKGYAVWLNPGGIAEKHIITGNTASVLNIESYSPIEHTSASCAFEIYPLVLRMTTKETQDGTADSGSTTTITDATLSDASGFWNGYEVKILSGNNMGLIRTVNSFTGTTLTFDALPYVMAGGDSYTLYLSSEDQIMITAVQPTANVASTAIVTPSIADAIPDYVYEGATYASIALDDEGNLVSDVINTMLNTNAQTILGNFSFGTSPTDYTGAFKTGNITWNASTGAITGGSGIVINNKGIIGATAGVQTFSIDGTTGSAVFTGTIYANQIIAGGGTIPTSLTAAKATDPNADQTSAHTAAAIAGQGALATLSAVGTSQINTTVISGGKIVTGLLTADNIQTGTLTGIIIQSATSGQRIIIYSTLIDFADASAVQAAIYASGGQLLIAGQQSGSNIYIMGGSSGATILGYNSTAYLTINSSGSTFKAGSTITINGVGKTDWPTGTPQTPWAQNINANGYYLTGLGKFQLPVGSNLY